MTDILKNVLVSGLVAVVAVALGLSFFASEPLVVEKVVERVVERLGGFPGPDIDSNYLSVNGVTTHYRSMDFQTGTTTVCSFEIPFFDIASSTLVAAGARIDALSTTTGAFKIAKGLGQNSTTTTLAGANVGANTATGTTVTIASSTSNELNTQAGDRYLVFDYETDAAPYLGRAGLTGGCFAEWKVYKNPRQ